MKKLLTWIIVVILCLGLSACGQKQPVDAQKENNIEDEKKLSELDPDHVDATETQELSIGDSISNDKFVMTFDSMEIHKEYSMNHVEGMTFSPYIPDGYQLLVIRGHFENNWTEDISESIFIKSVMINDKVKIASDEVYLFFFNNSQLKIGPYSDCDFALYTTIPEKLVQQFEKATFYFGFNDDLKYPTGYYNEDSEAMFILENRYAITGSVD